MHHDVTHLNNLHIEPDAQRPISPSTESPSVRDTEAAESAVLDTYESVYLELYFQIIQPQWLLFDHLECRSWFRRLIARDESITSFEERIIKLICATGALFCSSFKADCRHLSISKSLYRQAMETKPVDGPTNTLIRIKFLLVQVIYLLHQPDTEFCNNALRATSKACRGVLREVGWCLLIVFDRHTQTFIFEDRDEFSRETEKVVLSTCFTINEVVCSTWSLPKLAEDEALDKTVRIPSYQRFETLSLLTDFVGSIGVGRGSSSCTTKFNQVNCGRAHF